MLTEERRAEFHEAVATHNLKTGPSRSDKPLRVLGVLAMVVGVIGAFVMYSASLGQGDTRDILSSAVLAVAFLGLTILGGALYVASAIAGVLRLWLLRQLIEGRDRADQLEAALLRRD